ncbi:hypothetical protein Tco_1182477 [Tanacetum coccineum]
MGQNWWIKSYDYVEGKEKYGQMDDYDDVTHDDETDSYVGQDGGGATDREKDGCEVMKDTDRLSAVAQVEEKKSAREIELEK